jgi:ribonuclease/clavin/mitogillin
MGTTEIHEDGVRTLRVDSPPGSHMKNVLVTLVGEGPYILIDTGYPECANEVVAWVASETGGSLDALLLTHHHQDHLGGAEAIVAVTGAATWAHPIEIELMKERAPSLTPAPLEDKEIVRLGEVEFKAVFTPGHSPGHLAFWWEARRILFGGDNVLMETSTWVGPPRGNLRDFLASLEVERALAPRVIYSGHGPPVEDPVGRIDALLHHRTRREGQVLEALAAGVETPEEMAASIYRGVGEKTMRIGTAMLAGHLEKLIEEGRVRRDGVRYLLAE